MFLSVHFKADTVFSFEIVRNTWLMAIFCYFLFNLQVPRKLFSDLILNISENILHCIQEWRISNRIKQVNI